MQSLLFNFLDELLFIFHTEFFVACELEVSMIDSGHGWAMRKVVPAIASHCKILGAAPNLGATGLCA